MCAKSEIAYDSYRIAQLFIKCRIVGTDIIGWRIFHGYKTGCGYIALHLMPVRRACRSTIIHFVLPEITF